MVKRLLIILVLCGGLSVGLHAQDEAPYTTFSRDTLVLSEDSILIIATVCAPICSSYVMVENAKGEETGEIPSPFKDAVVPEAYIENGKILWRDNTYLLLDEDEKRWQETNKK